MLMSMMFYDKRIQPRQDHPCNIGLSERIVRGWFFMTVVTHRAYTSLVIIGGVNITRLVTPIGGEPHLPPQRSWIISPRGDLLLTTVQAVWLQRLVVSFPGAAIPYLLESDCQTLSLIDFLLFYCRPRGAAAHTSPFVCLSPWLSIWDSGCVFQWLSFSAVVRYSGTACGVTNLVVACIKRCVSTAVSTCVDLLAVNVYSLPSRLRYHHRHL